MTKYLSLVVTILMLMGCYNKQHIPLTGKLVLGGSSDMGVLDLKTMQFEKLCNSEDRRCWGTESFTKLNNHSLLFNSNKSQILEFNLQTKSIRVVSEGHTATFIPEHQMLFFSISPQLWLAEFDGNTIKSARSITGVFYANRPIQISNDEVVMMDNDESRQIYKYNITDSSKVQLPIQQCVPYVWRSQTKQLLCYVREMKQFVLTGLDGKHWEYLPEFGGNNKQFLWFGALNYTPLLYLDKFDVLILSTRRWDFSFRDPLGEDEDIWAYDFKTKKMDLLLKGQWVLQGSAVWFDN